MAESETIKVPHLDAYLEHLEFQRRLSLNTVRNYRKAVLIFVEYLVSENEWNGSFESYSKTTIRSFLIEQQRRVSRRTIHNYTTQQQPFSVRFYSSAPIEVECWETTVKSQSSLSKGKKA